MSRPRIYQLIGAAAVSKNLSTIVDIPQPTTESQARPLTTLPPEKQGEAWNRAVEIAGGKQPTAKHVEAAVAELKPDSELVARFKSDWPSAPKLDRRSMAQFLWKNWTDEERDIFTEWMVRDNREEERSTLEALANR